jgi:hypothetical protein
LSFHFVNKNLVLFYFRIILLTHCAHTHLLYIRSQFSFLILFSYCFTYLRHLFYILILLLNSWTILLCLPYRGSNFCCVWFFLLCFTLCPFVTKRGSNFYFWTGIVFLTGQVIFVPKWPKWEFVSLKFATFCWTKSLRCKDAF